MELPEPYPTQLPVVHDFSQVMVAVRMKLELEKVLSPEAIGESSGRAARRNGRGGADSGNGNHDAANTPALNVDIGGVLRAQLAGDHAMAAQFPPPETAIANAVLLRASVVAAEQTGERVVPVGLRLSNVMPSMAATAFMADKHGNIFDYVLTGRRGLVHKFYDRQPSEFCDWRAMFLTTSEEQLERMMRVVDLENKQMTVRRKDENGAYTPLWWACYAIANQMGAVPTLESLNLVPSQTTAEEVTAQLVEMLHMEREVSDVREPDACFAPTALVRAAADHIRDTRNHMFGVLQSGKGGFDRGILKFLVFPSTEPMSDDVDATPHEQAVAAWRSFCKANGDAKDREKGGVCLNLTLELEVAVPYSTIRNLATEDAENAEN